MTHPFTPTYIAMAQAAEEIQAMRESPNSWTFGDWSQKEVYGESDDGIATPLVQCLGGTAFDGLDFPVSSLPLIFLPRLDQLLGMLGQPYTILQPLFGVSGGLPSLYLERTDWHELALAVVMRDKYGKTWRDGKWEVVK